MKEKIKKIRRIIILVGILFPFFSFAQNTNNEFTGVLAMPGTLRDCPSSNCKVIRYYAETSEIKIVGLDDSNEWYQAIANDDYGNKLNGWMHYSLFTQDLRNSFSNNQQKRNNDYVTFNLTGNEKLHCIANDLTWIFIPQDDTVGTILFAIKNPYKSWYRVKINKTPHILPGSYNYSEQQIKTCQREPRAEREELGYWIEEKYIPENIKSSVRDMELFGKQTLGSKSFYVEKKMIVRECPSSSCDAEWLGGWGGIATVVEQNNNKDWYKVIISNVDTRHFDTVGAEGWVDGSIIPENIKQAFIDSHQKEQTPLTDENQTPKEETQNKFTPLLSFFQNKNFQTSLIITFVSIVVLLSILLLRKKIKAVFQLKWSEINLQKIKSKRKSFAISTLVATGIVIGIVGISYGAVYHQTSKLVSETEQLTKAEKYNEAIEKLELIFNMWTVKNLGIKRQEISNKINEVGQLLVDKTEYNQGIEEFNKGNWEKAKELLSKVSEISPCDQEAKNKIEEVQKKITGQQIIEAVGKVKKEITKETESQSKAAENKLKEQIEALHKQLEEDKKFVEYVTTNTNLLGLINHEVIRNISKGTKVTVIKKETDWSHVKIGNQEGWLENRYLADSIPQTPDLASIIAQWRPLVVRVECDFRYSDTNQLYYQTSGSGVVLNLTSNVTIVTNLHILTDEQGYGAYSCNVRLPGNTRTFFSTGIFGTTNKVDGGYIEINNPDESLKNLPWSSLCERHPSIGEKVVILGYPSIGTKADITATEGIISGYEGDYYITSAKIDQGNSGGAGVLVEDNCFLGLPTYVILGKIESLGRILRVQTIWE